MYVCTKKKAWTLRSHERINFARNKIAFVHLASEKKSVTNVSVLSSQNMPKKKIREESYGSVCICKVFVRLATIRIYKKRHKKEREDNVEIKMKKVWHAQEIECITWKKKIFSKNFVIKKEEKNARCWERASMCMMWWKNKINRD